MTMPIHRHHREIATNSLGSRQQHRSITRFWPCETPTARAAENGYLRQLRQPNMLFISATDRQLLALGRTACNAMRSALDAGAPIARARSQADQAVAMAAHAMGLESDRASNMHITEEAERHLC